jgi:hypothetical protein
MLAESSTSMIMLYLKPMHATLYVPQSHASSLCFYYREIYCYTLFFLSDCQLYAVGKPVYHRYTNMTYGSWMRDSAPPTEADTDKFWFTDENDPNHLYEYFNKTLFRAGTPSFKYRLGYPFKVTLDSISGKHTVCYFCL